LYLSQKPAGRADPMVRRGTPTVNHDLWQVADPGIRLRPKLGNQYRRLHQQRAARQISHSLYRTFPFYGKFGKTLGSGITCLAFEQRERGSVEREFKLSIEKE